MPYPQGPLRALTRLQTNLNLYSPACDRPFLLDDVKLIADYIMQIEAERSTHGQKTKIEKENEKKELYADETA
jgi:hypothetical protein